MKRKVTRSSRGGFSLIEVAVATAIVGIGMAALLAATMSGTRTNDAGKKLTQAVFLAQGVREWTLGLPFSDPDPADADNPPGPDDGDPQTFVDDLDDLIDVTYSPPRDGQGMAIHDLNDWSQTIQLTWVNADDPSTPVIAGASDVILVSVTVSYLGQSVVSTGWLVTRTD